MIKPLTDNNLPLDFFCASSMNTSNRLSVKGNLCKISFLMQLLKYVTTLVKFYICKSFQPSKMNTKCLKTTFIKVSVLDPQDQRCALDGTARRRTADCRARFLNIFNAIFSYLSFFLSFHILSNPNLE